MPIRNLYHISIDIFLSINQITVSAESLIILTEPKHTLNKESSW